MLGPNDLSCGEIVEVITDYLEDALADDDRTRFELHIVTCRGCEAYLEQVRTAIAEVAHAHAEPPDPEQEAALLAAFRGWHARRLEAG